METTGRRQWIIPGGRIPFKGTGREPAFLCQDKVAILNLNKETVSVQLTVHYQDEEPVGGYRFEIKGERVCKFRVNDLINPFPVILEKEYSLVIEAEAPVVVQFLQMNTGKKNLALMGTIAFGTNE